MKKTQFVIKLKLWQKSSCDKTQIVTKLKLWHNSYCDKKLKNSKCDKTQMVTKLENSKDDKTQKIKLWQNSKTWIVTKLEIWQILMYEGKKLKKDLLVRTYWHLDNQWDVLWAAFCDSRDVFVRYDFCCLSVNIRNK